MARRKAVPQEVTPAKRQVAAWLESDLADRFETLTQAERRSMSSRIALLIESYVDEQERQAA